MNMMIHAEPQAARKASETAARMTTWDGTELFYRGWFPAEPFDRAIILFHRGHEHSGRWAEMVRQFTLPKTAFFAWDARGHGDSPGERGYAENLGCLIKDVDAFVHHIAREYDVAMENIVVVAHSVAAVLVSAWVHDYAPPFRGLVLATPAFRVKLYAPGARTGLKLLQRLKRKAFIKSYVGGRLLTHDQAQAEQYDSDPQISRAISVNILLDLFDTSKRIVADAGAITTPTLLLVAGADAVVHTKPQWEFFANLSSTIKEMEVYDDFRHSIFHESARHLPIARVQDFIVRLFQSAPEQRSLARADIAGFTKSEFEELTRPLPATCPRHLGFVLQRLAMKTLGRLSDGVRIGWQTGFDSGQSLDYVYENRPRGITPLGRLIDRAYLNSIGWRGIRKRKENLQKVLRWVLAKLQTSGEAIRIVDIAAGPGRYLLEVLTDYQDPHTSAVLRDRSEAGLEQGRKLAQQMNIQNVRYEAGDAFDPVSLGSISPRPNIAIVSGLYELFPRNAEIQKSLAGLDGLLQEDGYLIYTNQPWHPQVEMIARVLINRDGKPWIMRRRTQAEMDELVRGAGFEKIGMETDPFGIFTVSIARKQAK